MNLKEHWDAVYTNKVIEKLTWQESIPEPSLKLIRNLDLSHYAEIISVGTGTSNLIEFLLEDGFQNITVNDISSVAMQLLKEKLGKEECNVEWVQDDLTAPTLLKEIPPIDLWYDRAVLHFFIEEKDQLAYFNLLKQSVKSKGYVIIATFAKNGAKMCSGLPLLQYDEEMVSERLGFDFEFKDVLHDNFETPGRDRRPFIYTVYQRK